MAHVTIQDVRKMIVPGGPRLGQVDTLVTYQDEAGNYFLVTVPKENPSDQEVHKAIKDDMDQRHRLKGQKITL